MSKILGSIILPEDDRKALNGDGAFVYFPVRQIFQSFADASTSDADPQDLYSFELPGATLFADGQALSAVYAGSLSDTHNAKNVWFVWFGQPFPPISTTTSGGAFRIEILAMRADSHTVRVISNLSFQSSSLTHYGEIPDLNLNAPHTLLLKAETPDAAGDVTLRLAQCEWHADI